MKEIFAVISAALIIGAAPPYIIDTVRRKTSPERVTWLIFGILGLIAFISQVSLGASWSLLFSGLDTAVSIFVFCLSIKYGVGGHTKWDIGALTIAGIGVVIAFVAKAPTISLAGVILADFSGVVLTIKKAYLNPKSETTISWLLVGTASLFGVLAVGRLSFGILLYPFYLMIVNYAIPITQFSSYRLKRPTPRTKHS
jgi:hypothetical protein